ncbi:hypothetical protein [Gorillibacterium timonense]|uniref:hypothetical protein n=1 Tax=Gorillibacterium timonense TaxID=1689269 RepID=UPI00071C5061|nr:hypothetical protein [Gorillibacterium timonense]
MFIWFRRFAFWFTLLGLVVCIADLAGSELANAAIHLNPILSAFLSDRPFPVWLVSAQNPFLDGSSALFSFRLPAYLIYFGSFALVGWFLDSLAGMWRRLHSRTA